MPDDYTYRHSDPTLEDRVWNTILAHTTDHTDPPNRHTIVRLITTRFHDHGVEPAMVDGIVDGLIEQGVIEETPEHRLRIVTQL